MTPYDKAKVLSLLTKKQEPKKPEGTITFWYGGWSLLELQAMRPDMFDDQSWNDDQKFAKSKAEPGMYEVALRKSNSNIKTFDEQKALLKEGEDVAPVAVAATAALLLFLETGADPFYGDLSRCRETTVDGNRVLLDWDDWDEGRLSVDAAEDDRRYRNLWSSSVRRLPDKAKVLSLLTKKEKPKKPEGTITFWYGGWSLLELQAMRPDLFYEQSWYDDQKFAKAKAEPGIYEVALRKSNSNIKTFDDLKEGEDVATVAVAATAALLLFLENSTNPFGLDVSRCCEMTADGNGVALHWREERLGVLSDNCVVYPFGFVWSSSVRKTS